MSKDNNNNSDESIEKEEESAEDYRELSEFVTCGSCGHEVRVPLSLGIAYCKKCWNMAATAEGKRRLNSPDWVHFSELAPLLDARLCN